VYRSARREADRLAPDLVAFARELIRVPSVSLSEKRIADRVEARLRELEYDLVLRDEAGNVVGVMAGANHGPTLLLNSHMDTVPPWDEESSPETPFSGAVKDGRLCGHGASDCKGGLAAQVYAGPLLTRSELPLNGDLVVAATVAEENGCSVGVRHLLEETLPRLEIAPSFAILGEPTSLDLCYGHDGWVDVDIRVRGENLRSVRKAGERIAHKFELFSRKFRKASGRVVMRSSGPEFVAGDDGQSSTVRITRRLSPGEAPEQFISWVRGRAPELVTAFNPVVVDVEVHRERQRLYTGRSVDVEFRTAPWATDLLHPFVGRVRDALLIAGWKSVAVRTWALDRPGMGTPGSLLVNQHRIPTLGFGPGDESQVQARHESVNVDRLATAAYGTAVLAHRLIGEPVLWPYGERRCLAPL
jgi:acetylornithine deacetylase/succinyl-diaminopimelate desuccinylase-like protein